MKTKMNILMILSSVLVLAANNVSANDFHPEVPLLDKQGLKVVESGNPFSTLKTCGACHDAEFIQAHSDHSDAGAKQIGKGKTQHTWDVGPGYFGAWDPIEYDLLLSADAGKLDVTSWLKRYGSRHVGGGPVAALVEMDCLLCHSNITDNSARNKAMDEGDFSWANSAHLSDVNAVEKLDGEWHWNVEQFNANGSLVDGTLLIRKPQDENCAQCHGQVDNNLEQPLLLSQAGLQNGMTLRTGQILSPQKVNMSGLNVSGKDHLTHAFDVHSDRILGCVNCHYSLNNPVYFQRNDKNQPEHLVFDPRRLTSAEYLQRPLHQFAKGNSSHGLAAVESENSLRRCESCHEAENVHEWLPYKTRHFAALACESCHIPELYGPTLQSIDWSVLNAQGEPLKVYRNSDDEPYKSNNMLTAYEPILLPRDNVGGKKKLAPFNLIASWYWTAGENAKPVSREQLLHAFFKDGQSPLEYRDGLLSKLDADSDGLLSVTELRMDSEEKLAAIVGALTASGLSHVTLASELNAFSINHNVVNGKWATKDCQSCHHKDSKVDGVMVISDYTPGGLTPVLSNTQGMEFSGSIEDIDGSGLAFHADASESGFYVIGKDGLAIVDLLGMMMFFGISLGVTVHGVARKIANKRMGPSKHTYHREYIYDAYERLWHWMQAGSILILLMTGLIIHKPHIFGMFSFAYIVEVHNVVGFILLINAALSLFYHLASGEIKQYLPEPKGFIGRSMEQAMYYSKGIFKGDHHPIEKTHDNKLNPLQQVTYLAILNLLLPAQIITGILIWGAQRWPELAQSVGGLPLLAPAHTLLAWAFATFIVMHVYLTTTGHTPTAGIKAMVEGWDQVEDAPGKHE